MDMGNIGMAIPFIMPPENGPISADKPGSSYIDNETKNVVNDKATGKLMLCDQNGWCEALPPPKNDCKPPVNQHISVVNPSVDYGI
jgi:hypothetical protein